MILEHKRGRDHRSIKMQGFVPFYHSIKYKVLYYFIKYKVLYHFTKYKVLYHFTIL